MTARPLEIDELADRINGLLPVFFASNSQRLNEFITLYLEQSSTYLNEALTAHRAGNLTELRRVLHAWCPAMPMIGLLELHELAHSIEHRIDEGNPNPEELSKQLHLLSMEATACAAILRSYRREL